MTCAFTVSKASSIGAYFYLLPQEGVTGVSINGGDIYTNNPEVELSVIWPYGYSYMLVANDGGFAKNTRFDLEYNVPWTLQSSGPERLPKTVYVVFNGEGDRFTDDIILDETPPTLSNVSASGGAATSSLRTLASTSRRKSVNLKTKASDKTSGVASIQVGSKKSSRLKKLKYRSKIKVSTSSRKLWVRVFDRAGNASRWKSVRVR